MRGAADGLRRNARTTPERVANVNKMETSDTDLPQGLVGPSSVVPIKVNNLPCIALMDSGSNLTIIFEYWYKKYLSHVPLNPISNLTIWGLAESKYPYRGYVVVEMEFPEEMAGVKGPVVVLALVCPELKHNNQAPVIVGTNAFLFRRLWELSKESGKDGKLHSLKIRTVYDNYSHKIEFHHQRWLTKQLDK